jgi:hypothetical protein
MGIKKYDRPDIFLPIKSKNKRPSLYRPTGAPKVIP